MFRCAAIGLFCLASLAGEPLCKSEIHAPWVSCFSEYGEHWVGARTVRTPTIISSHGKLKAYAQVEAKASGPQFCKNTVRLFVSTPGLAGFRQVYMEKPSDLGGTANSLGPINWSPDGRWLLVEFGNWFYGSDAGGLDILLYDNKRRKMITPDLTRIFKTKLNQECSIRVVNIIGFDAASRIHLKLADDVEEGEDQPTTHCFHDVEEWALDPSSQTLQPISPHP
jgi:hypothetical protein